jgi:predicted aminopeptidase
MNLTDAAVLKQVMSRYDQKREQWFAHWGSYAGFDQWFTGQVSNPSNPDDAYNRWCATDRAI